VPWNIYDMSSIVVIAGLTRAARLSVYLVGAAQRGLRRGRSRAYLRRFAAAGDDLGQPADGSPSILYAVVLLFSSGWKSSA
jgi:hypothetical protein